MIVGSLETANTDLKPTPFSPRYLPATFVLTAKLHMALISVGFKPSSLFENRINSSWITMRKLGVTLGEYTLSSAF